MEKDKVSYDIQENLDEYIADFPDKEVRIINAAINAFSEKGFTATPTKEIARRAGIAEGTIFNYFPTKDAILERMVPLLIKVMQPKIEKPLQNIIKDKKDAPVKDVLAAILLDRINILRGNERFLKSVLPELIHRAPLLNQLKENILPIVEVYIAQVLEHGKKRGEIRGDVNPRIAMYQMVGFVLSYGMFEGSADEQAMRSDIDEFIKYAMEGWSK